MLFPSETRADECRIKNVELRISKEGIISAYFQSKFDIGYSTFDIFQQAPLWEIRGANLLLKNLAETLAKEELLDKIGIGIHLNITTGYPFGRW